MHRQLSLSGRLAAQDKRLDEALTAQDERLNRALVAQDERLTQRLKAEIDRVSQGRDVNAVPAKGASMIAARD